MSIPNIFRVKRGSGPPPQNLQAGEPCYDNNNDAFYIGKITSTSPTEITPMLINGAQAARRFKPASSYTFSTDLLDRGTNLFNSDPTTITKNQYPNDSGVMTNTTVVSTSDYIAVDPNTNYILTLIGGGSNNQRRVHSYDSTKTWTAQLVHPVPGAGFVSIPFTTNSDTAYIRFTFYTGNESSAYAPDEQIAIIKASTDKSYYVFIDIPNFGLTPDSNVTVNIDPRKNTKLILPFVNPGYDSLFIYSPYSGATVTIDEILIS